VVARALGGTFELSNLRPECQPCNSSDGAKLGNRMRPRSPLTVAQRRAIAAKRAGAVIPAPVLRSSRRW